MCVEGSESECKKEQGDGAVMLISKAAYLEQMQSVKHLRCVVSENVTNNAF